MGVTLVSNERFEYLMNEKPPVVHVYMYRLDDVSNGGKVDVRESTVFINDENGCKFKLNHLTKRGYYSKRKLFIDFLTIDRVEFIPVKTQDYPYKAIIVLTDEEVSYLKENHDVKGKIWKSEHQLETENAIRNYEEGKLEGTTKYIQDM